MKARDIMVPVTLYLKPGQEIRDFVIMLRTHRGQDRTSSSKSLPVLNEKGEFAGIVSIKDVLRAVYPSYFSLSDLGSFTWDGMLETLAKEASGKKISEIMNPPATAVKEDDPLMECVDHILRYSISTLPVVDEDGRLKGMIYESDIFFTIADAIAGNTGE
ncbi:MAG TPA: CBS domain-containing protein [Desulfomonilia bacterium]|jgi:CBS domain-containing protein